VVLISDRHRGNTLPSRLLPQQWRARAQGRLREAVRGLGRHQPGSASVTTGTARPSTQPLFSVET
jgi:hypothetical protein